MFRFYQKSADIQLYLDWLWGGVPILATSEPEAAFFTTIDPF
jgi:hypothetical protein